MIDEQIRRHMPPIVHCYKKEAEAAVKPLSGKLISRFVISPTGKVVEADFSSNTLHNENVEKCVLNVIKKIVFPAPANGGTVEVSFPFMFTPNVDKK